MINTFIKQTRHVQDNTKALKQFDKIAKCCKYREETAIAGEKFALCNEPSIVKSANGDAVVCDIENCPILVDR